MAGVTDSQIKGYISNTLSHFRRKAMFEFEYDETEYYVMDNWFREGKIKVQNGKDIDVRYITGNSKQARHANLFARRDFNHADFSGSASAPWCNADTVIVYEARLMTRQADESALLDYMKARYIDGLMSKVETIDLRGFATPESANDERLPRGVPFWINFIDAGTGFTPNGGFLGKTAIYGDGSTTTAPGGFDKGADPLLRNFAAHRYPGEMSLADLRTLSLGMRRNNFKGARDLEQYYKIRATAPKIYMSIEDAQSYEDLQNATVGGRNGDLNPFGNNAQTYKGVQIVDLSQFDHLDHRPIYVLRSPHFFPVVHGKWWMRFTEPMNSPDNAHVYRVQVDSSYNFVCDSPRKGGLVIHDPIVA